MSSDGAHLGMGAEDAMKAVIAGEQPTKIESADEMYNRIMTTTIDQATTYDGVATYMAKVLLTNFMADPTLAQVPTENVYEKDENGQLVFDDKGGLIPVTEGLWTVLQRRMSPEDIKAVDGMSGFMWGWAVNAARRCLELGPVPNPAIIEVG